MHFKTKHLTINVLEKVILSVTDKSTDKNVRPDWCLIFNLTIFAALLNAYYIASA